MSLLDSENKVERVGLRETFDRFWKDIRGSRLYAGQPRNAESSEGVTLAREALRLAKEAEDSELKLEACRMLAYSLTANEQYRDSIPYYEQAIPCLEQKGDHAIASRTRIGYVYALTHVGRYEDALNAAGLSERWMKENHDDVGYARLCTNIASLHQRLDQYQQSHDYYAAAAQVFETVGDKQAAAQVYLNMGYTLARIERFEETEAMYERAESMAHELGMDELWAQASYNHAYFFFLVGRYSDALQSFGRLRTRFKEHGSLRHVALCDLDEAEIYLQLDISADAATLAQSASHEFRQIGMLYEEAKAQAFHGVALTQLRRFGEALETFKVSQTGFASEGNQYWVAVLDLYRADVHFELSRYWEAQALALRAKRQFEALAIPSRRMLSLVLLGRIALALQDPSSAERYAEEIALMNADSRVPLLRFPYQMLCGIIAEQKKDWPAAIEAYSLAATDLEMNQSRLRHDDLRLPFLRGRNQVYESLISLSLAENKVSLNDAYSWCERAKSRSLVELLSHHLPTVQPRGEQSLLTRVHRLREELNLQYVESKPQTQSNRAAPNYEAVILKEQELAKTLREVAVDDPEYVSLQRVTTAGLDAVQEFIPESTTLVEYFSTEHEVIAFVISRKDAKVFRKLASPGRIQVLQQRLAFQLEKFLRGPDYVQSRSSQILETTNRYLQALHDVLIEPLISSIQTQRITIIPHGLLHVLPFHAFHDGRQYLIDRFEVTYAPSASILRYCMEKPDVSGAAPLIMGVADKLAPRVDEEVRALGEVFTDAQTFSGPEATRKAFSDGARSASFVHIATHATFRQDSPMFSSFKLADGHVTALDLFSMNCQTNLVTLSGCSSGLGKLTGTDDMLGLMRGFLYAGARSLLFKLWNVSDESTVILMTEFYKNWRSGEGRAKAFQGAMTAVRASYPNPFHWAPFILVGKP